LSFSNLIPAFSDGRRAAFFAALLAMRMNYARATQVAATIGQGSGNLSLDCSVSFYNPMLLFIALFVYLGATQEATLAQLKDFSAGLPVSEAMVTDFKTLPDTANP